MKEFISLLKQASIDRIKAENYENYVVSQIERVVEEHLQKTMGDKVPGMRIAKIRFYFDPLCDVKDFANPISGVVDISYVQKNIRDQAVKKIVHGYDDIPSEGKHRRFFKQFLWHFKDMSNVLTTNFEIN